jgi:hypothetical protein
MGNAQIRQALDTRHYRIECSFYIREERLRPIRLEWDRKEGDDHRTHRYKWKFGPHKGELLYSFQTPKSKVFLDILHELGFQDASPSDLRRGVIKIKSREDRNMIVFVPNKRGFRFSEDPEFYVDNGMLEPVELSHVRQMFPNPDNADDVTFHGSTVYYKDANKGTIVYRPQAKPLDLFRLAVRKMGYYKLSAGHFRSGSILVDNHRIPILTFQVPTKS